MKVKTLVAMGVSSLLAVSIAHAAPAINTQFVDDATSTQPATTDATSNPGAMDSSTNATNPGAASTDPNAMPNDNANSNPGGDEDTQDTATGDSDY